MKLSTFGQMFGLIKYFGGLVWQLVPWHLSFLTNANPYENVMKMCVIQTIRRTNVGFRGVIVVLKGTLNRVHDRQHHECVIYGTYVMTMRHQYSH